LEEWKIASPPRGCSACGKEFAPGATYRAQLFDEATGFVRRDLCEECHAAGAPGGPAEPFSRWTGRVPAEEERRTARLVDDDLLVDFFKRLEGSSEPQKQRFRYILCLILMRKKLLKFTDVIQSGDSEYLVVEERSEKVAHRVLDPKLTEQEIESLRVEVGRILTGGDFEDSPREGGPGDGNGAGDAGTTQEVGGEPGAAPDGPAA